MTRLEVAGRGARERSRRLGARTRRIALSVVGVAAIAAAAVVLVSLATVGTIRSRFDAGRDGLEHAQAALVAGDFTVAGRRFRDAATAFRQATSGPKGPLMRSG